MNPLIKNWIIEALNRMWQKSPKFFQVVRFIALVGSLAGWVPIGLTYLEVSLSEKWIDLCEKVGVWFTGWFISSFMPTQSKISVSDSGEITKKTNDEKLPFTASVEKKEAEKL